jgi:hypothetical protein
MKALKVFEKFTENSDPITDMGIGVLPIIEDIKNNFFKILGVDRNRLEDENEYNELTTKGTYLYQGSIEDLGMDDTFDFDFSYDYKTNKVELSVLGIDRVNEIKHYFTIKADSLKKFREKLEKFWDIWYKKEKKLTKDEKEQYEISESEDDED